MIEELKDVISYTFKYGSNCATSKIEINPHYDDIILYSVDVANHIYDVPHQRKRLFNACPSSITLDEIDGNYNLLFSSTWYSPLYEKPLEFNHVTLNELAHKLFNLGVCICLEYDSDIKMYLSMIISCFITEGYTEPLNNGGII